MTATGDKNRLDAAARLGRRALVETELSELVRQALEAVSGCLKVEFCSAFELLPNGDARLLGSVGFQQEGLQNPSQAMSEGTMAGHVIRTLEPLAVSDFRTSPRFSPSPWHRAHAIVASAYVPLYGRNRPLGVLGAHSSTPRDFSSAELLWLQVIANILSSRLETGWLSQAEYDRQLLRAEQMMAIGQVAAGVAHELRNPLTSIKGLVQVNLRDLVARGLPAEDLAIVEHEIRRMERTLQTFLDFARPPQPNRRLVDMTELVQRVLSLVGGRASKQQVAIRFLQTAPVETEVDQDQIQQLLLNLVLNALDAMPQGGTVEIDLRTPRDGFVELYVRDTGPGIAPHILPKVFETFVSSKETGVGLGLPLSKRIAEDHGGNLSVYNLPAAGACFVLRLPARAGDDGPLSLSAFGSGEP